MPACRLHRAAYADYSLMASTFLDRALAICEHGAVKLVYERPAIKGLRRVPREIESAVRRELEAVADDPFAHHQSVTALVGTKDGFRLRVGGRRAVYRIDRESQPMIVEWIGPRGDAYR